MGVNPDSASAVTDEKTPLANIVYDFVTQACAKQQIGGSFVPVGM